ncbi:MAG: HD domain-containing protein [Chloroflexi bacterium]|nr:HD domain-containing protein [Chloroflexota bacterium]
MLETLRAFLRTRPVKAYFVGGTVRDVLLGREVHDLDLAVQGNASDLARAFADSIGAAFYVMDEAFDVARVIVERDGARDDARPSDSVTPQDGRASVLDFARARGDAMEIDLATRDFTVNAMAADAVTWNGEAEDVIDPLNGLADLQARRIRAVSNEVFRNDAVRLVRAVRFEAELQFGLDEQTAAWIQRDAALIENAPMERVRDELMRIFGAQSILRQLRRLDALDLLGRILPEVNAMRGVTQSPPHIYDVFEHSLYAVAAAEETERARYLNLAQGAFAEQLTAHFAQTTSGARTRRELLRLTLLLHDIGKPATRTVQESGRIRYFGHEDVGAQMVEPLLRRLKFSNDESVLVRTVLAEHLRPIFLAQNGVSDRAVYRFFRDTGAAGIDVAVHAWCDQRATYGEDMPAEIDSALQAVIGRLLDRYYHAHEQVVAPSPLLNGDDIMQYLNIPPGPRIRVLLDALREAQAVGQVTTREEAFALLDALNMASGKL